MLDMLPFPNINGNNPNEKIEQIAAYLVQLKEELEFVLGNISVDNLSKEVIEKIESVRTNFKETKLEQEEQIQQIANNKLTVDDVIASKKFEKALDDLETEVNAYTDNKVGEVDEALDGILTIQNELIGVEDVESYLDSILAIQNDLIGGEV